jgi:uncharacterized membrane protein required for colicin V production
MFEPIVSFITGMVRRNGLVFGFGGALFATYSAVDISFTSRPENASIIIGLGLFAFLATIWGILGYAIGAAIRWISAHLQNRHHVHH